MSRNATRTKLRKLLRSKELAGVQQGLEMVELIAEPELLAELLGDTRIDDDGTLQASRGLKQIVARSFRARVAIALLRLSGALERATALSLPLPWSFDPSVLSGLPGLESLRLGGCSDLSGLRDLPALRSLELSDVTDQDLAPLQHFPGLQRLSVRGEAAWDLGPLAGLSGLEALHIEGALGLRDLSPLAGLSALRELTLSKCQGVDDLSPLTALGALERLDLSRSEGRFDLEPVAQLHGLRALSITGCPGVSDLSPLRGLRQLRRLTLNGSAASEHLEGLRGAIGLVEGIEISERGEARRDGRTIEGEDVRNALWADPTSLAGATQLSLYRAELHRLPPLDGVPGLQRLNVRFCRSLRDLYGIEQLRELEYLELVKSVQIEDAYALIALRELNALEMAYCEEVRPRFKRPFMWSRDAVTAYRAKLARGLARLAERTPAQEALLEMAREEGLID